MCCHFTKTGENHHSTYTHILMESIAPLLAYIFLVFTSLVSFICEIRDKNNCRIGTPGESLVWKENVFLLIVIHPLSMSVVHFLFYWSNILCFDLFFFFFLQFSLVKQWKPIDYYSNDEGKTERENDCLIFFRIESKNIIIESTNNWIGAWDWIRGIEKNPYIKIKFPVIDFIYLFIDYKF